MIDGPASILKCRAESSPQGLPGVESRTYFQMGGRYPTRWTLAEGLGLKIGAGDSQNKCGGVLICG